MASDFFQFPFIFLLCPIASNNIHDNTQCWQPIPRPSFGKQVPYSKIIVYILFGTGILMMSKKERPARIGTRMARAHICEHQLLLSNFTNEPNFPSTSHDQKKGIHPDRKRSQTYAVFQSSTPTCVATSLRVKHPWDARRVNATIHAQGM